MGYENTGIWSAVLDIIMTRVISSALNAGDWGSKPCQRTIFPHGTLKLLLHVYFLFLFFFFFQKYIK